MFPQKKKNLKSNEYAIVLYRTDSGDIKAPLKRFSYYYYFIILYVLKATTVFILFHKKQLLINWFLILMQKCPQEGGFFFTFHRFMIAEMSSTASSTLFLSLFSNVEQQ